MSNKDRSNFHIHIVKEECGKMDFWRTFTVYVTREGRDFSSIFGIVH